MRIERRFFEHLSVLIVVLLVLQYTKLVLGITLRVNYATEVKCIESERQALLKFKQGLVDYYGRLSSWGMSHEEDCCKWRRVKCNNRTGHITFLDLNGQVETSYGEVIYQRLSGMVSPSLLELKHLNYLDLSSNDFGTFPEFIGSLTKLQHLNLASSNFFGPIPHQLGNLTNLRSLDLGYNFGLTVKNLEWLSHLRLLRYLDLSFVSLMNTNWLQSINMLSFLIELRLSSCNLPGNVSLSLPLTNSSSIPLTIIDMSKNLFDSSSSYDWLVNLSSSSLVELNMGGNPLGDSIPDAFGNLVSLEKVDLSSCGLKGEIPKSFRSLRHLNSFELSSNKISGQLPEFFQSLATVAVKSLEFLNLQGNRLRGSLPDFTTFSSLRELRLADNELNGSFPESFGQISGLVYLDVSRNQMTGPLPDLEFLRSLRELYLSNNKLNGRIPKSLGQFSKLEILDASSNSFEGTISEDHLSNLSKLNTLDLCFNSLTLEVDSSWTPPFQLDIIGLGNCKLGPHFPSWLQSQNNFSMLDISGARISDTVPAWFWDLPTRLTYLNISNNQINGLVPDLTTKFLVDFQTIDLSSNRFMGPIPLLPQTVTLIDLSKNLLTGSVSVLCTTGKHSLTLVDLSDNLLSGKLPDCWTEDQELFFLNLANNNLSGEIPSSIGFLIHLRVLQLRNNSFVGELPLSLKSCNELMFIDLGLNKLSGEVPAWIGMHLKKLIVLSFRRNKFYGSIPSEICQLNNTQILDLSQNNISGNIPLCFNNFGSLVEKYSLNNVSLGIYIYNGADFITFLANALVQWKGKETEYKKTLGLLKCIDLSSNKLVGTIPPEFASLMELVSLNLSKNNLTGNIIQEIGQMRMLESIDFSRNHLSGNIPMSLSNLTFLSVLDLSNNSLSGKIPLSTQLQSFDASVYGGNRELCGLPLPNKCLGDGAAPVPPSVDHGKDNNNQEDEDRFITTGFYVSVTLGFIIGFWGFCGPLLLQSSWRHSYFKKLDKIIDWIYVTAKVKKASLQRKFRC